MSRDGHAIDPFGRPCWCGDVHAECTCTGVGLRTKLATLTGRTEHSEDCPAVSKPYRNWCGFDMPPDGVIEPAEVSGSATSVESVTLSRVPPATRRAREIRSVSTEPLDGDRRA